MHKLESALKELHPKSSEVDNITLTLPWIQAGHLSAHSKIQPVVEVSTAHHHVKWHRAQSDSSMEISVSNHTTSSGPKNMRSLSDFGQKPDATSEAERGATMPSAQDDPLENAIIGLATRISQIIDPPSVEQGSPMPGVKSGSGRKGAPLVPTTKTSKNSHQPIRTSQVTRSIVPLTGLPAVLEVLKKQQSGLPSIWKPLKATPAGPAAEKMTKVALLTQKFEVQVRE